MKKLFLLLAIISFTLTSCYDDQLDDLQDQIAELQEQSAAQIELLQSIITSLNLLQNQTNELSEGQQVLQAQYANMINLITMLQANIDQMNEEMMQEFQEILDQLDDIGDDVEDLEDIIQDLEELLEDCCADCSSNPDNELAVRSSSNDPNAFVIEVEDDEVSDWTLIHTFEIDIDGDSFDLNFDGNNGRILFELLSSVTDVSSIIDDIEVDIDGQEYDDWSYFGGDGSSTTSVIRLDLEGEGIILESDEAVEVEIWVRFKSSDNYTVGETIQATVSSFAVDIWNVFGSSGVSLDATQLQGASSGNIHTLLTDGAIVTLNSTDAEVIVIENASDIAEFEFDTNLEMLGLDGYLPQNGSEGVEIIIIDVLTGNEISTTQIVNLSMNVSEETGADGNEYYSLDEGDIENLQITVSIQPGAGSYRAELRKVLVSTADINDSGFVFSGVGYELDGNEFRTNIINLVD